MKEFLLILFAIVILIVFLLGYVSGKDKGKTDEQLQDKPIEDILFEQFTKINKS